MSLHESDVCIIGGGITSALLARKLANLRPGTTITIVEAGRGKKRPGDIMGILNARDRHAAGDLAPGHGLCLWAVRYG